MSDDEIARLRAENQRYREALGFIQQRVGLNKVWGGTTGWIYRGVNHVEQRRILDTIDALFDEIPKEPT